ncbi:MAG: hypothetical protein M3R63_05705 [Actinomycetota bacterium]|nr:hypothetical protein [Actinomycetota bacterium]
MDPFPEPRRGACADGGDAAERRVHRRANRAGDGRDLALAHGPRARLTEEAAELVGLAERLDVAVEQLSGGKVAVAVGMAW